MKANRTLLDVFFEVQTLDRIPRAGYVLRGVAEPESVTEHAWHVLFLTLADYLSRESSLLPVPGK